MSAAPIIFTTIELMCVLRWMRSRRDALWMDIIALQERARSKHNGEIQGTVRALDNELMIIDNVIRKLWRCVESL